MSSSNVRVYDVPTQPAAIFREVADRNALITGDRTERSGANAFTLFVQMQELTLFAVNSSYEHSGVAIHNVVSIDSHAQMQLNHLCQRRRDRPRFERFE